MPAPTKQELAATARHAAIRDAVVPPNSAGTLPSVAAVLTKPVAIKGKTPVQSGVIDERESIRRVLHGSTPQLTKLAARSNQQVIKQSAAARKAAPVKEAPVAKKTKAPAKTPARKAPATLNKCQCGCGASVAGRFKQGHDARLKGMLLRGEVKSPNADQRAFAKSHGVVIGSKAKGKAK